MIVLTMFFCTVIFDLWEFVTFDTLLIGLFFYYLFLSYISFSCRLTIRDEIIPCAISWFTGEAALQHMMKITTKHSNFLDSLSPGVNILKNIQVAYSLLVLSCCDSLFYGPWVLPIYTVVTFLFSIISLFFAENKKSMYTFNLWRKCFLNSQSDHDELKKMFYKERANIEAKYQTIVSEFVP